MKTDASQQRVPVDEPERTESTEGHEDRRQPAAVQLLAALTQPRARLQSGCGGSCLSAGAAIAVRETSTVRAGRPLSVLDDAVALLAFAWRNERSSCLCGTTCGRHFDALDSTPT